MSRPWAFPGHGPGKADPGPGPCSFRPGPCSFRAVSGPCPGRGPWTQGAWPPTGAGAGCGGGTGTRRGSGGRRDRHVPIGRTRRRGSLAPRDPPLHPTPPAAAAKPPHVPPRRGLPPERWHVVRACARTILCERERGRDRERGGGRERGREGERERGRERKRKRV